MENFQNKRGLKGCKWSSLNAPGTENHLSHPLSMLGVQRLFPIAPRKNSNGEWRRGSPITKLRFCFISFMCWIRGCEFWVILLRYSSEAKAQGGIFSGQQENKQKIWIQVTFHTKILKMSHISVFEDDLREQNERDQQKARRKSWMTPAPEAANGRSAVR